MGRRRRRASSAPPRSPLRRKATDPACARRCATRSPPLTTDSDCIAFRRWPCRHGWCARALARRRRSSAPPRCCCLTQRRRGRSARRRTLCRVRRDIFIGFADRRHPQANSGSVRHTKAISGKCRQVKAVAGKTRRATAFSGEVRLGGFNTSDRVSREARRSSSSACSCSVIGEDNATTWISDAPAAVGERDALSRRSTAPTSARATLRTSSPRSPRPATSRPPIGPRIRIASNNSNQLTKLSTQTVRVDLHGGASARGSGISRGTPRGGARRSPARRRMAVR